ncbi:DUF6600 domain-containing protein [uncultured Bacteroides sp.]|uniref:DUF6600 domain-containing protein n=1 Tax=uncultured Bacteroides sp. TaxID=162156 RepID=UPI002AAA92F1|nr:DUF6600 domain-containing protein [uncultured Bacteroides sp.]
MKANVKILTLIFVLTTSCASFSSSALDQQSNVSFQVFYDQLGPYGEWTNYSNYGYVWIPYVREDFTPYSTNGHWVLTQYGWSWMSDYSWGWAPFHYGRWGFNDALGWFWVPGYEWGPSWVNWIQADGYYGWSPMEPGMSISFTFNGGYDSYHDHWCFVRDRDFGRSNIDRYYVNRSDHERIIRNARTINRTYTDNKRHSIYVYGPDRESVQRTSGRTVNPYNVRESDRPVQEIRNKDLHIYRPQINRNSNTRETVPSRVINKDNIRRTPARDVPNRNQNVNPAERPTSQPEKRDVPRDINVPPARQQDKNESTRPSKSDSPDRNKPDRRQDVTTPQKRTQSDRNRTRASKRDNTSAKQSRSTEQKEK